MERDLKQALRNQALDAQGPPSVLGWDDSTRFIDRAIQRVILENADIGLVLKEANKELNKRIEK